MSDTTTSQKSTGPCQVCGEESTTEPAYGLTHVCAHCGFVGHETDANQFANQQSIPNSNDSHANSWIESSSVHNATEKRLRDAFDIINRLGETLNLGAQARIRAADLFGQVVLEGITDGRDMELLVLGSLYWSERTANRPLPLSIIALAAGVELPQLRKSTNTIEDELEISLPPTRSLDYVPYIAREVNMNEMERNQLEDFLRSIEAKIGGQGKNPVGIAAAGTYYTVSRGLTQAEISQIAGISTETLRVRLSDLREMNCNND